MSSDDSSAQPAPEGSPATGGRNWGVLGPALVALVAVVVGGYFAWLTIFRSPGDDEPAARSTTITARSEVNRAGGYSLVVPTGMKATRKGKATLLVDARRGISVTITTTASGPPKAGNAAVLTAMRSTYAKVQVAAVQRQHVAKRPAYATYGTAVTKQGERLPFLLLSIRGSRKNYALSGFAAPGADPAQVRPRFLAVVGGFRIGVPDKSK